MKSDTNCSYFKGSTVIYSRSTCFWIFQGSSGVFFVHFQNGTLFYWVSFLFCQCLSGKVFALQSRGWWIDGVPQPLGGLWKTQPRDVEGVGYQGKLCQRWPQEMLATGDLGGGHGRSRRVVFWLCEIRGIFIEKNLRLYLLFGPFLWVSLLAPR